MNNQSNNKILPFTYEPELLPREGNRHYISANDEEIAAMLAALGLSDLKELFKHIDPALSMSAPLPLPEELGYDDLQQHLIKLSQKNRILRSFVGDGLPQYRVPEITAHVSNIRNLTTSYTPYQPERSQGTLMTHWLYQCALTMLTGFEAINISLYDRDTALFESLGCALRLTRKTDTVLVSGSIFPSDLEVLRSLSEDTSIEIVEVPADPKTGLLDPETVRQKAAEIGDRLAAIAFPQINSLGLLEEVDEL